MRLLPDTHLLLWAATFDGSPMPGEAAELIEDPANTLYFSAVSVWELAIKSALRRPDFSFDPRVLRRGLLSNGYLELDITGEHAAAVVDLPLLHRDPFDRMLVAQATVENITLLTVDPHIAKYAGPIRRV